jgi:hypothetical protein
VRWRGLGTQIATCGSSSTLLFSYRCVLLYLMLICFWVCIHRQESLTVPQNIEAVLGLRLPKKGDAACLYGHNAASSSEGIYLEDNNSDNNCAYCFLHLDSKLSRISVGETVRSAGSVKSVACHNGQCNKLFHVECVKEWFASLTTCKISFGKMYGTCPYCSSVLETNV